MRAPFYVVLTLQDPESYLTVYNCSTPEGRESLAVCVCGSTLMTLYFARSKRSNTTIIFIPFALTTRCKIQRLSLPLAAREVLLYGIPVAVVVAELSHSDWAKKNIDPWLDKAAREIVRRWD